MCKFSNTVYLLLYITDIKVHLLINIDKLILNLYMVHFFGYFFVLDLSVLD